MALKTKTVPFDKIIVSEAQKDKFKRLVKNAKREKMKHENITSFIYVAEKDGFYHLIDGLWRLAIYKVAKVRSVPCNVSE